MVEKGVVSKLDTTTGADGKVYPRPAERKAPEPELPMLPARPISIPVAKPGQVAQVAAGRRSEP